MRKLDIAWLSGWLEGEGYFGTGVGTPVFVVNSTDRDVVERAATLIGHCKVVPIKMQQPHWKQQYRIQLYGAKAAFVMETVKPFMGQRRRAAIDAALNYFYGKEERKRLRKISVLKRKDKEYAVARAGDGTFVRFG